MAMAYQNIRSPFQLRRELVEKQLDFSQPENRYRLGRGHLSHRLFIEASEGSKGETLAELEEGNKDTQISTDDLEGAMKKSEEKEIQRSDRIHGVSPTEDSRTGICLFRR